MAAASDAFEAALDATLAQLDADATLRATADSATWRHSLRPRAPVVFPGTLPVLRLATVAEPGDADFLLKETLGHGGMGLVQLAEQRALRREVAVKRLKPTASDPALGWALLREALIGGALEHPNIVPIHALGCEANGQPVLVMKRVEGRSWRQLLDAPAPDPRGARGPLERHIEVLIAVSNAVDYAHSRGVVHRDLKPENVMIGGFGEVYVLDWGVARRLEEPVTGDLVGTPAYMAPEMLLGGGAHVSPQTDVHQLGAILHEIVTGRPRHTGADIRSVLRSILASEPYPYDSNVSHELAEICQRATNADPAARFASAGEFRDALTGHLAHRASLALTERATERMQALRAALAEPAPSSAERIYRTFAECRFGFQQALQGWGGNAAARAGLDRCLEAMLDFELAHRRAAAASALVAELSAPSPDLRARVASLEAALADERERAALQARSVREADLSLSAPARGWLIATMSVLAGSLALVLGALEREGTVALTHWHAIGAFGLWALFGATAIAVWRRSFLRNEINRRFALITMLSPVCFAIGHGLCLARDLPLSDGVMYDFFIAAAGFTIISLFRPRTFVPHIFVMLATSTLIALLPRYYCELLATGALAATLPTAYAWIRVNRSPA